MVWIVTADTNTCRIYSYDKNHSKLSLLKEIKHPEMRLKTSDTLTTDRPGHYIQKDLQHLNESVLMDFLKTHAQLPHQS